MFDWLRQLDRSGRRTFWACFGGYALDAMDVQMFSFAMPVLIGLWGLSNSDAGVLASVTLIFSAIGGWGAGLLADRIGRVPTLQITIVWFAVFTFLSGLTTSFEQLLVTRALQGIGFGGEWATGSVLIGEVIAARHRGKAGGIVQSGWAVGWGAAALLSTVLFIVLPEDVAWRWLFFVGILPAFRGSRHPAGGS
jgi:MFS family permease